MENIKIGDFVVMNGKYPGSENKKDVIFQVIGLGKLRGADGVVLKGYGPYWLDGVEKVIQKTAKEMFEELNYQFRGVSHNCGFSEEEGVEIWEHVLPDDVENYIHDQWRIFFRYDTHVYVPFIGDVDAKTLKAIYKRFEELGWLDENTGNGGNQS